MNAVRFLCWLVAFAPSVTAIAGDLNPPAGPVAPTMKTLQEVEPRRPISMDDIPLTINIVGGSFYLTENLLALGVGQNCITVNASDVTIDLNGFAIDRTEVGFWSEGILVDANATNVAIRNGTIRGSSDRGINGASASGLVIENVRVYECGREGIFAGINAIIRGCAVVGNINDGIEALTGATIENCLAHDNANGFDYGIIVGGGSVVRGCTASGNNGHGISLLTNSVAIGCAAIDNTLNGFSSGQSCLHIGCVATRNGDNGFFMSHGSSAIQCNAMLNEENGFRAGTTLFESCVARSNSQYGISAGANCAVIGNLCSSNLVGGILVTSFGNRVDGNTVLSNPFGIDINDDENIIIRNCAYGNTTDYSIVPGNAVGQILDFSGGAQIQMNVINGIGVNLPHAWVNLSY